LATLTNDEIAYLELLLRATGDVARFLRERKAEVIEIGVKRASETEKTDANEPAAQGGAQSE